jgi:hypothetical protein
MTSWRSQLLIAAIVIFFTTSGCGSDQADNDPAVDGPYAAEIRKAADDTKSEYERQVMADGVITRREYDETVQRMVTCAQKQGVDVGVTSPGGIVNQYEVIGDGSPVFDRCSETHLATIESLYSATVTNPNKEDIFELDSRCLRKSGLADASFTAEKYKRAVTGTESEPFVDAEKTMPFDTSDPRYDACMTNPAEIAGPPPSPTN